MTGVRAVVLLALVGICRIAYFHFVSEPLHEPRRAPIDLRYQRVRSLLPGSGEIGYVSDLPPATRLGEDAASAGTRLYLHAQYSLAPLVLRSGDVHAALVIANVSDPARVSEVLDRNGLRLVASAAPGVVVARPR